MGAVQIAGKLLALPLILIVLAYQWTIRPLLGNRCRFYPSCSDYSLGALKRHGAVFGTLMTVRRLACCHPFHPGGVDPVPDRLTLFTRNS